jgi:hypothetical protein
MGERSSDAVDASRVGSDVREGGEPAITALPQSRQSVRSKRRRRKNERETDAHRPAFDSLLLLDCSVDFAPSPCRSLVRIST